MLRTTLYAGLCAAVIAAGSTGCALLDGGGAAPAPRGSLAGTWMLNENESSDTARASLHGLEQEARAAPDGDRSAGRPAGTYPAGRRAGRVDGELAARVVAAARGRSDRFTIADSAGVLTLRTSDGPRVVVTPDGSTSRRNWLDGTISELRARWVQQRLEIVRRLDGGITVQEYYSRSPGSSRLVIFAIVSGPFDGEITVRRVYDLVS
jgi:hypothetical protein